MSHAPKLPWWYWSMMVVCAVLIVLLAIFAPVNHAHAAHP